MMNRKSVEYLLASSLVINRRFIIIIGIVLRSALDKKEKRIASNACLFYTTGGQTNVISLCG